MGNIQAGRLRALGVTTGARVALLPDIPALGEFVSGYEASSWNGIWRPRTRRPVLSTSSTRNAGLADPNFKGRLAGLGLALMPMTTAEFGKLIADDIEKWGKVIRVATLSRTNQTKSASIFHNAPLREFDAADVRFGSLAAAVRSSCDVCFAPESGHGTAVTRCPLRARSCLQAPPPARRIIQLCARTQQTDHVARKRKIGCKIATASPSVHSPSANSESITSSCHRSRAATRDVFRASCDRLDPAD